MIAKILNEDNSTQYLKFFYIERLLKFPPNSFVLNKLHLNSMCCLNV